MLTYVLSHHLGSTSLVTSANGAIISQTKYKAWGEVRQATGTSPTNYTYTGQYSYTADFGLMFYNARWYDPALGRFAQADTIVPAGAQGLDRYAYVNNSPMNYVDPSGHLTCQSNYCDPRWYSQAQPPNGLSEGGLQAFEGLREIDLFYDTQGVMEFVVDTEYGGAIDSLESSWPLNKAMTRLYHTYCNEGAWTAKCLNGFWSYNEGVLLAATDPEKALSKMSNNANVPAIASEILNYSGNHEEDWGFVSDLYSGGCDNSQSQVLCGWAVINSSENTNYYSSIYPPAGEGQLSPYLDSSTSYRYVLAVDNTHLLVVLSPYQQYQDYLLYGNGDYDYNITNFK